MLEKINELLEAVTVAEAASLTELKTFGCIESEEQVNWMEWADDDSNEVIWDMAEQERPLLELW